MIRGVGILVGLALIAAAILQAVARDWTIDGVFLLLAGVGLLMLLLAALTSYESIDETQPGRARIPGSARTPTRDHRRG